MVEKLIKKIARSLDRNKIPYMIIGGQAVLVYGRTRLTNDIDITVGLGSEKFSQIQKLCEAIKLKILSKNPFDFAQRNMVVPARDKKSSIRVDFIFSFTPYESQALERTKSVSMDGYPVKFASCEDIIIHKLVAGRAVDDEDVKSILIKNKKIDFKYINKWLAEFEKMDEYKGLSAKFKKLLGNI